MESGHRIEKEQLSRLLRQWATEDMKYHTSAYNTRTTLPTDKAFEKFCQRPLVDIWPVLLENVKPAEFVKHVKDNLALQKSTKRDGGKGDEEGRDLRQRIHKLEAELKGLTTDGTYLEQEQKQGCQHLQESSMAYEKSINQVRDLQRKRRLIQIANKQNERTAQEFNQYTEKLNTHRELIQEKSGESNKNNFVTLQDQDDESSEMETQSCSDVRLACKDIGLFFKSGLDKNSDQQIIEANKTAVLDKVTRLHSEYNVHTLTESLLTHTTTSSMHLREETFKVNIAADAKTLSFFMDQRGVLHDKSDKPSVHKSVQNLLQASHLNHVMRWSEEQQCLNENWKLEARLDDLRGEVHKQLVKTLGSNPSLLSQAQSYVDRVLCLASEKAVGPCLKQEVQSLVKRITTAESEQEELRGKLKQIKEFTKTVEKKQMLLGSLARYNSTAPGRLDKYIHKCKTYLAERPLPNHLDLVQKMTSDLMGSMHHEVTRFLPLPLGNFLQLTFESGLSTSAVLSSIGVDVMLGCHEYFPSYTAICDSLRFPYYKSSDQLMSHILEMQASLQRTQVSKIRDVKERQEMCRRANVQDDPQHHRDMAFRVSELAESCLQQDVRLIDSNLPRLKTLDELVVKWIPRVNKLADTKLEAWWEQPAQYTTPWLTVDGLTYDLWVQRFRAIVSQVHQREMEREGSKSKAVGLTKANTNRS